MGQGSAATPLPWAPKWETELVSCVPWQLELRLTRRWHLPSNSLLLLEQAAKHQLRGTWAYKVFQRWTEKEKMLAMLLILTV